MPGPAPARAPARARARSLTLAALVFALALAPAPSIRADVPAAPAPAPAPPPPAAPDRMAKLVGLAGAWLEARVTHPAMLRGAIDLDAAAVAAIPKVEAARTKPEYAAAIAGMLAVFKDPATRVDDPAAAPAPPAVPVKFLEQPAPKLAVVTLAALADPAARAQAGALVATLPQQLKGAEVVMFDLRAPGLEAELPGFVNNAAAALPAVERWSVSRSVVHHGFRTQHGVTSGGYDSQYALAPRTTWQRGGPGIKHVVFIADARTPLPEVALGLQASGKATIASAEPLTDVPTAAARDVDLPWGLVARVRAEEVMMPDGTAIHADAAIPAKTSPHAFGLELARRLLAGGAPPAHRPGPVVPAALPTPRDDRDWPEAAFPPRELRIFAAIRAHGLLSRFYAYLDLAPGWEARLPPAILTAEAATDARSYRDALMALGAHLHDGHLNVFPASPYTAGGRPGLELRLVEQRPIVTAIEDPELSRLGVHLGDELISVDGVPIDRRRAERRPVTAAGTAAALENAVLAGVLGGPRDQPVTVELRGTDGKPRMLKLPRDRRPPAPAAPPPHWKLLSHDLGYADLRLLVPGEVDAMFAAFAKTRGIVLDLRGYPNGTAWPIAPYLNVKGARHAAHFAQPLVSALDDGVRSSTTYLQPLPEDASKAIYRGKVAVLIDDRAISQAEHTCLFFEAAAGATFIGSPTHGSNGDITVMRLPGGLRMTFTGQAVRHADGRQLQQVGIQPTIAIAPTIAGVRAGKDEVLDRAIGWITTGR
jgi:C-terminal processing protease CtpA/Prc